MADDDKKGGRAAAPRKTTGRRANHSARKKEPVTIDAEPVKTSTPRAKKAESAAAPAPAKNAPATKASTTKASAKKAPAKKAPPAKDTTAKPAAAEKADSASKSDAAKTPTPASKPAAAKPADAKPADAKPADAKRADATSATGAAAGVAAASKSASGSVPKTGPAAKADIKPETKLETGPGTKTDTKPDAKPAPAAAKQIEPAPKPVAASAPPPKASEPARKGVGFGGLLAAGLVGGAISLGGAWLLGAFATDTADIDALRTQIDGRIAAVESSIPQAPDDALTREDVDASIQAALASRAAEGQPVEPDPRIATLSDRLAATREELDALRTSIASAGEGAADGTALAALAARVADLDTRLGTASAGPSETDIAAIAERATAGQVATLSERLGAADTRLGTVEGALAPLEGRIGEIDQRLSTTGETVGTIETSIADLRTTLDTQVSQLRETLDTRLGEVTTRLDDGLAAVRATNEEQGQALSSQGETLASQGETLASQGEQLSSLSERVGSIDERVGSLDTRMASIAEQVADTDPERRAATALALANLRTRIDDGEAYETELALVRQTNPKIDLAPLDPTAGSGIPTLARLSESLDSAAERIRAAVDPAPQRGADGLLANLRSVVKVKPLSGEAGQDVDATIGAIRAALADRDLAAADAAWQTLPEAGRQASADWHASLQARMRAKNFLSEALASLLQETGG